MQKSENTFLHALEELGADQARIESSSPLPEWVKPLASLLGDRPWQTLLLFSFALSMFVSICFYSFFYSWFAKGVLSWLLQ